MLSFLTEYLHKEYKSSKQIICQDEVSLGNSVKFSQEEA